MPYRSLTRLAGAALDLAARGPMRGLRGRLSLDGGVAPAEIWLHGASVGEITSAGPVITALAADYRVLVTANTPTGCDAAAALGVQAALAPLDTPQALTRFLDRVGPRVAVTVENELWPNRSAALAQRGVRQVLIGARLSERSARRWAQVGGLIRPMLARIDALSAQDAASEARLTALGLPQAAVLPRVNLKLIGPAREAPLPPGPQRPQTILAASTHEGEEALILDALDALRHGGTAPRLIMAPRHPQRFEAVGRLMAARGWTPALRSSGADATAPVLLADSMGEMDRWYAAAGICITGGSLVPRGGHTPWEPASNACAILHGPFVDNASEGYALLDSAGGAEAVTAETLAPTLARLLSEPDRQAAMGLCARVTLQQSAGDLTPLVGRIASFARD